MKTLFSIFCALALVFSIAASHAQPKKEGEARIVDDVNSALDRAVVSKNFELLEKHYAGDFVFTHSTGQIDSKESWIRAIRNMGDARFVSREHDSTVVELHGDVAILSGKLSVARESNNKISRYYLYYVRVFRRKDDIWQMISHRSTKEWH